MLLNKYYTCKWQESSVFACVTLVTSKAPSTNDARNPMADISNQLHNAVDSILSSFVAKCQSLPAPNVKMGNTRILVQTLGRDIAKSVGGGTQTTTDVLLSLQRPQVRDNGSRCFFLSVHFIDVLNECTFCEEEVISETDLHSEVQVSVFSIF